MSQKDERWRKKDERWSRGRKWQVKEVGMGVRTVGRFCPPSALALYGAAAGGKVRLSWV